MTRISELLADGADPAVDDSRLESELLLAHCLGQSRSWLYTWPECDVEPQVEQRFRQLLLERRGGEPIAYLLEQRDFWSLSLKVNRHTLIPRSDTETLVEWALELDLPDVARVVDLGTGSGAIALALASERSRWDVSGVDISSEALEVARENARALQLDRVRLMQSDWCAALASEQFDLVVANPPYIEDDDDHLRQGDLRFEPAAALASGVDGLDAIRRILAEVPGLLHGGSWLLLEHGYDQAATVRELLRAAGLVGVESRRDLAGHERISGGQYLDQ